MSAQSWTLYDGYVSAPTITFAPMNYEVGGRPRNQAAVVSLTMNNGAGGTLTNGFVMDTGSTGIVATPDRFTPGPNDQFVGTGSQYYSSSGRQENGNFYLTNVVINDAAGVPVATARVSVLQVTSVTCQFTNKGCVANANPTGVAYMGVGFHRGNSALMPPAPFNNTNPFVNIVSLASGASMANYRQGYTITNNSVTLGISSANTTGFGFVKLQPDTSGTQPNPAWLGAPVTISVNGTAGAGDVLPDSGIDYAFLTPPPGVKPPTEACPNPPGGNGCIVPSSNTQIGIFLPGQTKPVGTYTFNTNQTDNPTAPAVVQMVPDGPSIFINTGRQFYRGFDYVYDAVGGFVGYRWTDPAGASGASSAIVALVGNVNLPDGFSSTMPTYLMGATTLLEQGTGSFSAEVSGTGPLTIGSGQVNLTGVNTYTGGTIVAAGAVLGVQADSGMGAASGSLTFTGGALQALASLTLARPVVMGAGGGILDTNGNTITAATPISGPGSLTKAGLGTLILSGANTYAGGTIVNRGILQLGAGASLPSTGALVVNGGVFDLNGGTLTVGALAGAGGVISLGSGTLIDNSSANTTLNSVVTGTGGLTKTGSGLLNLAGASTYTGPTSVTGGTLAINGSITSNVTVGPAGTLGGIGTIVGTVTQSGVLAPGNSIGTLTVSGSYTQAPGSTYQVETNAAGAADQLNVIGAPGTATIAGGTVVLTAASGIYAPSTVYTILTATGGVTGTFAGAASLYPFLQPTLSYGPTSVFLTVRPGGFAAGAATPNQAAVGAALDRSVASATGDLATVIGAISTLGVSQGQAVMNAISGQNYAGLSSTMVQSSQLFMNTFALHASGQNNMGSTRVALAEACDVACDTTSPGTWSAWGGVVGGVGTIGGNANAGTLTYNLGGFAAGLDRMLDSGMRVGVTVGYTRGSQWTDGFSGRGDADTVQTGLYASYLRGPFYFDALAGYAYSNNRLQRPIMIPGLSPRTAYGQAGANQLFGQLEGGYRFDLGVAPQAYVIPFVRLQGSTATQNGFAESGADSLNLNVAAQTTNSLRSVLGATVGGAVDLGWRDKLALQLKLGWSHEFASTDRPVTASFAGAPASPFTTYGASPQRDGLVVGFNATTAVADRTSLYLRYEGTLQGQDNNHTGTLGVRVIW